MPVPVLTRGDRPSLNRVGDEVFGAPSADPPWPPRRWLAPTDDPYNQRAIECLEESLVISRHLGDAWGVAGVLTGGGGLASRCMVNGDFDRAVEAATESLALYLRLHDSRHVGVALRAFGHIASCQNEPRRATRLIAAFTRTFELSGATVMPMVWPAPDVEAEALRVWLGESEFEAARREGEAMTLDQAVAYALRREDAPRFPDEPDRGVAPGAATRVGRSGGREDSALTPREREVAILVGRGYTNRRIAEALVIAERTAEVHARNIREKLGLGSRAQIAAWVVQQGLLGTATDPPRTS